MGNKRSIADNVISFYTKYFAVWVVIGGILAYYFPAPFVKLKPAMSSFFALTMFGIGVAVSGDEFKNIIRKPVIVLIGCVSQFIIMPLGAFLLARIFKLEPELAVGLILTACAPGAMASNVMCYIGRADTAYSVSLTTVSTLLCPVLTPALTLLLAKSYLPVKFLPMFISVISMVVLPLFAGMTVRYLLGKRIDKILKIFPAISVTFIIFICSLVIALNQSYILMLTISVLISVLILNIYGMIAGYSVGSIFKLGTRRQRTLAIEIGMQNAGLGTVLALEHFSEKTALPAVIFVFVCILTASAMVEIWNRQKIPVS
ncbi:MAG: bile acid:sodium symporter family protein [Phycisphaerae bacterium]|nr:bile acid:sodium symporter family protein [Phycisphaerae bacterium]